MYYQNIAYKTEFRINVLDYLYSSCKTRFTNVKFKCALNSTRKLEENVKDLGDEWDALTRSAKRKSQLLSDAREFVLVARQCDDMLAWCDECAEQLSADDAGGHDLHSSAMLALRHEALARQIESQASRLGDLEHRLHAAEVAEHTFSSTLRVQMRERVALLRQRYDALHEPCAIRGENLREALVLYKTLRELSDAQQWCDEMSAQMFDDDENEDEDHNEDDDDKEKSDGSVEFLFIKSALLEDN